MEIKIDRKLGERLTGIYFRIAYLGFGENSKEDIDFINNNEFKVVITEETAKHGYDYDREKIKKLGLELNKPYTMRNFDVGRSYSNIELKEFHGELFNAVNFEFIKL